MKTSDAIRLSLEKDLDLIETVPTANPPIARIMSFDKYRYQEEKKEKKERLAQKTIGIKQIRISARAQKNDLLVKIKQLEKFLNDGHPTEIIMRLRGREKYNKEWAFKKIKEFLGLITVPYQTLSDPKFSGNGLIVQVTKK